MRTTRARCATCAIVAINAIAAMTAGGLPRANAANRAILDNAGGGQTAPATATATSSENAAISLAELAKQLKQADESDAASPPGNGATPEFSGPPIEPRVPRPKGADTWPKACSFRHPICVHEASSRAPSRLLATLGAAERAWELVSGALALPEPEKEIAGAYDLYLVDGVVGDGQTYLSQRSALSGFDRASAYSVIERRLSVGCALEATVAREVARAALFRAAPATDEGGARAETTYLAQLMVPCGDAAGAGAGAAVFQRYPELAIPDPWRSFPSADSWAASASAGADFGGGTPAEGASGREASPEFIDEYERGAALFFWWLDAKYAREPGGMVRALWALSPTKTPLGAWHWRGQPDWFDVLRVTFKGALGALSSVDDLLVQFAVARAFFGASDDGAHLSESRALGDAGRVRFDWDVPWPDRPRRLASPNPVAPTGASYIAIRKPPTGAKLHVEATWEERARMRWTVVKVGANGAELAEFPIVGVDRETGAGATIENLDATDTILIVGTGVGDARRPFDPNDEVFEPHGWLVTIRAE